MLVSGIPTQGTQVAAPRRTDSLVNFLPSVRVITPIDCNLYYSSRYDSLLRERVLPTDSQKLRAEDARDNRGNRIADGVTE